MSADPQVIGELYRRMDSLSPDQQAIVQELGRRIGVAPGINRPSLPSGLQGSAVPSPAELMKRDYESNSFVQGARQMSQGGSSNMAGGLHQMVKGTGQALLPEMALGAALNPIAAGTALAAGTAADTGVHVLGKSFDVDPNYTNLAGDAAAIAAGGLGAKKAPTELPSMEAIGNFLMHAPAAYKLQLLGKLASHLYERYGGAEEASAPAVAPAVTPQQSAPVVPPTPVPASTGPVHPPLATPAPQPAPVAAAPIPKAAPVAPVAPELAPAPLVDYNALRIARKQADMAALKEAFAKMQPAAQAQETLTKSAEAQGEPAVVAKMPVQPEEVPVEVHPSHGQASVELAGRVARYVHTKFPEVTPEQLAAFRQTNPVEFQHQFEQIAQATGSKGYRPSPDSTAIDQFEEAFAKLKGETAKEVPEPDDDLTNLLQRSIAQLPKKRTVAEMMK